MFGFFGNVLGVWGGGDVPRHEERTVIETPRQRRLRRAILVLGVLLVTSMPIFFGVLSVQMAHATKRIAELEAQIKECKP